MVDPQHAAWSPSPFLKAWDDYVAASQEICERLKDPNANGGGSIPLPIFGAWQEFAKSLGMQSDLNVAPASTRTQWSPTSRRPSAGAATTGHRATHAGDRGQFQRRYAEFLKQSADISEQALQATRRRIAADPRLALSPAAAYEAWIEKRRDDLCAGRARRGVLAISGRTVQSLECLQGGAWKIAGRARTTFGSAEPGRGR